MTTDSTLFWAKYSLKLAQRRQRWMVKARKYAADDCMRSMLCVRFARECNHDLIRGLKGLAVGEGV